MHSIKTNTLRRRRRDALPRRVDEPRDRVPDGRGRVERRGRPQVDDPPRVVLEPYLEECRQFVRAARRPRVLLLSLIHI